MVDMCDSDGMAIKNMKLMPVQNHLWVEIFLCDSGRFADSVLCDSAGTNAASFLYGSLLILKCDISSRSFICHVICLSLILFATLSSI